MDKLKNLEDSAVNTYKKVEDTAVEKLFQREGETLEEAKARLLEGESKK